jgi:CHAT domain-containing protein
VYVVLRGVELINIYQIPGSQDRPRLHWCPTGELTFLPLHAAGIYRLEAANADCCADYVVSSYTPTLSALIRAREEAGILDVSKAYIALVGDASTAPAPDKGRTLPFLPNVQLELGNIEAMASAACVGYLETHRDDINIANITDAFSSADIIHLACHGVQDAQDALSSGFCLGDGRFSVLDIMKLSLGRRLFAFLSACETAKGDEDQPDEVVHLAASMLFLGFRSIVATMW